MCQLNRQFADEGEAEENMFRIMKTDPDMRQRGRWAGSRESKGVVVIAGRLFLEQGRKRCKWRTFLSKNGGAIWKEGQPDSP